MSISKTNNFDSGSSNEFESYMYMYLHAFAWVVILDFFSEEAKQLYIFRLRDHLECTQEFD